MSWQFTEKLSLDVQGNYTKSEFHRESPTFLVITPASSGMTVNFSNDGGIPSIASNVDLNNPANFIWSGGRVNMQDEKRETETKGGRANLRFGDDSVECAVRRRLRRGVARDQGVRQQPGVAERRVRQQSQCLRAGTQHAAAVPGLESAWRARRRVIRHIQGLVPGSRPASRR